MNLWDYAFDARIAYQAYGDQVGWQSHMGHKMPDWEVLPQPIQLAWCAAAKAVITYERSRYEGS